MDKYVMIINYPKKAIKPMKDKLMIYKNVWLSLLTLFKGNVKTNLLKYATEERWQHFARTCGNLVIVIRRKWELFSIWHL